ncbi:thioredoxin family protein [Mucilaginibacter pallidiroseus]|uniref:Thioredoxin family protein n=1 Tax=Mucilaginibacter pallidiroseus TaxID=2599295 RepID=A0A563UGG5_9SPHI|nr:thioredoxin family protein [Mucilaginibacter pallidiroseus]TWR30396.1 thioredoxin family protein [Mucilaginibacter pallidiroseus]
MRKLILIAAILTLGVTVKAQEAGKVEKPKIYNPEANAKADIAAAVKTASAQHKNVLLQIGGNWCSWCYLFNDLVTQNAELNKHMNDNYVVLHVNYSKENTNDAVLAGLGYPQRFGFPVFVILDGKGNRLHTQNSSYLEEGKGHSKAKVMEFFQNWSPTALDPKTYAPKAK